MAQNIGINTDGSSPATSAMLDIKATDRGLLLPRVALTASHVSAPVAAPADALLIYNTATAGVAPNNVTPGFYAWNTATSTWQPMLTGTKGWSTTGNAGTAPATNFLGTTDAQDLVFKTGGSAVANERMRVLSGGQTVVNNTTIFTGDVFSVYGTGFNNGTPAISSLGSSAVNGYAAGDGTGIYGQTSATSSQGVAVFGALDATNTTAGGFSSVGVYGQNSSSPSGSVANARSAIGVQGVSTGTAGNGTTMGVVGVVTGASGITYGLYGESASPSGRAIIGFNDDATNSSSHAIQGQAAGIGGAAGLMGFNTANGVLANNRSVYGVRGQVNATGTGATASTGIGVQGVIGATTGTFYGTTGAVATSGGVGVFGSNSSGTGVGIAGVGNNVAGYIVPTTGCGIAGTGKQYGVMGFTSTQTATVDPATTDYTTNGANAAAGGYFQLNNALVPVSWAYVGLRLSPTNVLYKIHGNGVAGTIVKNTSDEYVGLACTEAPEALFQDFGTAQLENGKAHIVIDPDLAKNIVVNENHPLRVFVQLEGDCAGVYVSNKSATGFDVTEIAGGTSNVAFSYTVVANRADEVNADGSISKYSELRFAAAPGPVKSVQQDVPLAASAVAEAATKPVLNTRDIKKGTKR
jgi:hypothetical protein